MSLSGIAGLIRLASIVLAVTAVGVAFLILALQGTSAAQTPHHEHPHVLVGLAGVPHERMQAAENCASGEWAGHDHGNTGRGRPDSDDGGFWGTTGCFSPCRIYSHGIENTYYWTGGVTDPHHFDYGKEVNHKDNHSHPNDPRRGEPPPKPESTEGIRRRRSDEG